MTGADYKPEDVLSLWFPASGHQDDPQDHARFWEERMQGGMDAVIISKFAGLTRAAAQGELDHWGETARGRLALLIALDQFPRSLWRDTPGAFAQDIKATRLALEGVANGHFDQLEPWEQAFYVIAISHCEGPDHAERMDMLTGLSQISAVTRTGMQSWAGFQRLQKKSTSRSETSRICLSLAKTVPERPVSIRINCAENG